VIPIIFREPGRPILFLQDHWHPVVQTIHIRVRPRRHESEAAVHCVIRSAETFPDACESQQLPVLPCDRRRLLAVFDQLPLIERTRVHDAAALRQGVSEHAALGRGLTALRVGLATSPWLVPSSNMASGPISADRDDVLLF
jgi:hypothetical protein